MTEEPVTIEVLAQSLLDDFINNMIRQQTLDNLTRFKSIQQFIGDSSKAIPHYQLSATKDIFGQDKQKLKTTETSRYFPCDNCGRKIAGARFAQHMNKCLERRRT